ncbi:hypothetical protein C489_06138 [Natrinema versiforme JCM 10478]|uniref:Uncharacterized protein n=1 Tax=Natrinema versiforme JCM 10478 TaxID=1227496 RepID=L9Y7K8_9EURY|nr:hypothetical protein C489_06138 [Natrinema versiforme JCM 10478]
MFLLVTTFAQRNQIVGLVRSTLRNWLFVVDIRCFHVWVMLPTDRLVAFLTLVPVTLEDRSARTLG